jgi:hypothetical protein
LRETTKGLGKAYNVLGQFLFRFGASRVDPLFKSRGSGPREACAGRCDLH